RRERDGQRVIIARLKGTIAFRAAVNFDYRGGIGRKKWTGRISYGPGSISESSTWWCRCKAEQSQHDPGGTEREGCQNAQIEDARLRSGILFHGVSFVRPFGQARPGGRRFPRSIIRRILRKRKCWW